MQIYIFHSTILCVNTHRLYIYLFDYLNKTKKKKCFIDYREGEQIVRHLRITNSTYVLKMKMPNIKFIYFYHLDRFEAWIACI